MALTGILNNAWDPPRFALIFGLVRAKISHHDSLPFEKFTKLKRCNIVFLAWEVRGA